MLKLLKYKWRQHLENLKTYHMGSEFFSDEKSRIIYHVSIPLIALLLFLLQVIDFYDVWFKTH